MKKLLVLLALTAPLGLQAAYAQTAAQPAPKATAQQSKMTSCNKEAGGKKGDERKAFMKQCLSAKPAAPADGRTAQQEKMKTCNKDAADMKGDARKAFMQECLKKK